MRPLLAIALILPFAAGGAAAAGFFTVEPPAVEPVRGPGTGADSVVPGLPALARAPEGSEQPASPDVNAATWAASQPARDSWPAVRDANALLEPAYEVAREKHGAFVAEAAPLRESCDPLEDQLKSDVPGLGSKSTRVCRLVAAGAWGHAADPSAESGSLPAAGENRPNTVRPTLGDALRSPRITLNDGVPTSRAPRGPLTVPSTPVVDGGPPVSTPSPIWVPLLVAAVFAFAVILYRRLTRDRAVSHPTRAAVFEAVAGGPGRTAAELARALAMDRTTAEHHLRVLHEFGAVERKRAGPRTHWFKNGGAFNEAQKREAIVLAHSKTRAVFEASSREPHATLAALARTTGIPLSTVRWHLLRLQRLGVLAPQHHSSSPVA